MAVKKDDIKKKVTTTKKAETKVEPKVEEIKEVEEVKEDKPVERKKSANIDTNSQILVRSVTKGGLTYISPKTGMQVTWDNYGTEEYIDYGEILTMKSSKPRFLTEPYLVIDDEEVAIKLGYKKMYDEMIDIDNLENFYKQSLEEMTEQIEKSPKGIKKLIGEEAASQMKDGNLNDIRKIKLLEEKLNIELSNLLD